MVIRGIKCVSMASFIDVFVAYLDGLGNKAMSIFSFCRVEKIGGNVLIYLKKCLIVAYSCWLYIQGMLQFINFKVFSHDLINNVFSCVVIIKCYFKNSILTKVLGEFFNH